MFDDIEKFSSHANILGYDDSDRCLFDLWSPVDDDIKHPHLKPGYAHSKENRAFSPYTKHTHEVEDVINMIIDNFDCGNMFMTFELDDDFSESDLNYIRQKVYQARGIYF